MPIASPTEIYQSLAEQVIDQSVALQQMSVSLYKHLNGIKVGNMMLVGNSGTGKTTIMRCVEQLFTSDERFARHTNLTRMNANIVADDTSNALESGVIIERLHQNALRIMGDQPNPKWFKALMENAVVFLDEVDKIRGNVGDEANPRGILAQEALLTFIEGEVIALPLTVRAASGELVQQKVHIDTKRILFVCGGAFEGLYDMVYRRVAGGEHKDKLIQEYLIEEESSEVEEKEHFTLQDYVRYEDMFAYGMTPQFLGRFDEIIVLNDLSINGLVRIFIEPKDSLYREAKRYFSSFGIDFQITKEGVRALAEIAHDNHRLGARALRAAFKRVTRGMEFDPLHSHMVKAKDGKKVLTLTADMVRRLG